MEILAKKVVVYLLKEVVVFAHTMEIVFEAYQHSYDDKTVLVFWKKRSGNRTFKPLEGVLSSQAEII